MVVPVFIIECSFSASVLGYVILQVGKDCSDLFLGRELIFTWVNDHFTDHFNLIPGNWLSKRIFG